MQMAATEGSIHHEKLPTTNSGQKRVFSLSIPPMPFSAHTKMPFSVHAFEPNPQIDIESDGSRYPIINSGKKIIENVYLQKLGLQNTTTFKNIM